MAVRGVVNMRTLDLVGPFFLLFFATSSVRHHDGALLGQRGGRLGQRQKIRGGEGFNVFGTDAVHTFTRSHPLAAMLLAG